VTLDDVRHAAVARSLFPATTLQRALDVLGFVQADPIRAPARAQDLTLRHRVRGYRAGDLERRYARLDVHEDFFVNYGYVTSAVQVLMHPRGGPTPWTAARGRYVRALLDFVRTHGSVHPRQVDQHFSHGTVTNYWGGSSSATTHLLDAMHYRGLLQVVGRQAGIRIYAAHEHEAGPADAATGRAHLMRSLTSPFGSMRRCRRRACRASCGGCASPFRSGLANWIVRSSGRSGGSPMRAWTAPTGTGRQASH